MSINAKIAMLVYIRRKKQIFRHAGPMLQSRLRAFRHKKVHLLGFIPHLLPIRG